MGMGYGFGAPKVSRLRNVALVDLGGGYVGAVHSSRVNEQPFPEIKPKRGRPKGSKNKPKAK